jgi:DNA-binding GntR family transcriptional regulator
MSQTEAQSPRPRTERPRSQTLTSVVRDAIEAMIISGRLNSGERINESLLASELGVSRGPIREACRSLEQAGLLTNIVNQGAYVRQIGLGDARNLYEVRGALSGLCGRLFAERASEAQLSELAGLVDDMDTLARANDTTEYYLSNIRFHDLLVTGAGNPVLAQQDEAIVKKLHLFRRRGLVQSGNLAVSNREHREILQALQARDSEAAGDAMRRHVAGGWSRVSASI